jgi:polyketide synthase PksJ
MNDDRELQHRVGGVLADAVAAVIRVPVESLDWSEGLLGIGLDSITITELCSSLNEQHGLRIVPPILFEHSTLSALAKHVCEEYPEAFPTLREAAPEARDDGVETECAWGGGSSANDEPIAIVGMSGCFPGAAGVESFWSKLVEGSDCITEVPSYRWDWRAVWGDPHENAQRTDIRWGGFVEDAGDFDPLFFDISPREAMIMDPGQRLLLEHVWNALEDAGHAATTLAGTDTAIFAGVGGSGYEPIAMAANVAQEGVSVVGISPTFGPNRISYLLDIRGSSEAVQTACSSSLVAVHRAVEELRANRCRMAIAGGVAVIATVRGHIAFSKAGMLSRDGRCKAFSERADGYSRGEGAAFFVLRRLSDAERDRDNIYALILSSGQGHGGRASSLTAPNPAAHADLITQVWRRAGVDPRSISYIETHGTGTVLGDAVEIKGLTDAFTRLHAEKGVHVRSGKCVLGSVKSNIGHLEAAAGAAGLVKVVLQLRHRAIVRTLHCDPVNPLLRLEDGPFSIARETTPWIPALDDAGNPFPRRAGLSSFGIGGVNAHVAIEEYVPRPSVKRPAPGPEILVLSARTEAQLSARAASLLFMLQRDDATDDSLPDVCFTLRTGRNAMEHRLAFVARSVSEARQLLQAFLSGRNAPELFVGRVRRERNAVTQLSDDRDMEDTLARWMARGALSKVLSLWIEGLTFNWARVAPPRADVARLSLPGYPFARERYWLNGTTTSVTPGEPATVPRRPLVLKRHWEVATLRAGSVALGGILVLASASTRALAAKIAGRFPHVTMIDADAQLPADIDWQSFGGWIDVVECGRDAHRDLRWILALQRWIERGASTGLAALCVTRGRERFGTGEAICAESLHAGAYPPLQSEYSRLRSRVVDVDPSWEESQIAACIVDEWGGEGRGVRVCYRNASRFEARLSEVTGTATTPLDFEFPKDQVLWVTGGTRGLGLLCAQHLVTRHGVRKLVLGGRLKLPPRHEWAELETFEAEVRSKVQAVLALEAQGATVRLSTVRLSDEQGLRAELEDVRRCLGSIAGIIHAAGLGDLHTPAFIRKSIEGVDRVLEPKVSGTDNLIRCFSAEPLRFFVLFSSVAAEIPALGGGQVDYAMANAYMDSVANTNSHGLPIVSVQWPSWKSTGVGEIKTAAYRQSGLLTLADSEGLKILDDILARRSSGVLMPAVVDEALWNPHELLVRSVDSTCRVANQHFADAERQAPPAGPADNEAVMRSRLLELVSKELGIPVSRLEPNVPFSEYGVDSVLIAQLVRSLSKWLAQDVSPTIVYEHPTIGALSHWLTRSHGEAIAIDVRPPTLVNDPIPTLPQSPFAPCARPSPQLLDLAIVGMSCQFAGAPSLGDYWRLVSEGRSGIRPVPIARWGRRSLLSAGLLDNVESFDPGYFGLALPDARAMDPQALIILEEMRNAIYDAGYTVEDLKARSVGVFVGGRIQPRLSRRALSRATNATMAAGQNYLAANVSRIFDLHGPSLVVDTACSSALTAMSIAAPALVAGEISAALVGGISLLHTDAALRLFEGRGILQRDSKFHIFDKRGKGAILGEGAGVVMLKTLPQALADGDRVYGIIRGLSVNNDGRTPGPTAPNLEGQKQVIQSALARSGFAAQAITHVEVNGSGSEVTDLLELKAIESVYGVQGRGECELGSVKPNIGHPLAAEGIASVIKVALTLHHRQRVPFLSAQEPIRHFDFDRSPFRFRRATAPWLGVPVAAINCFGDGGTNAHVVIEAPPESVVAAARHAALSPPELNRIKVFSRSRRDRTRIGSKGAEPVKTNFGFWDGDASAQRPAEAIG